MRLNESKWVGEQLKKRSEEELSPILEVGSSSRDFRHIAKPHIEKYVHAPLKRRGIRILTSDIRNEEGVDIVGDVYDPGVQHHLRAVGARTILLCNLFEHLVDPKGFARVCQSFVQPGGGDRRYSS